jgi:hypothetical protein
METSASAHNAGDAASPDAAPAVHNKIGQLTRQLHDTLQELGLAEKLQGTAGELPDARSRLSYIARLTGEAAEKVLNRVDQAKTQHDHIGAQTRHMIALLVADPVAAVAKGHIMNSHRIHADWMAKRSDTQADEHGVPLMPEWIKECEAKKHTTLPTEVHQEEDIVVNAEEQEIFTQHEYLLQTHPKMKKKLCKECFEYLTSQKKGINAMLEDQQKCKKQVRFALKHLIKEWRMKVNKGLRKE